MEVKNVAHCAFFAPDPKLMTVDLAQVNKAAKERREKDQKLNPPVKVSAQIEYNRLKQRLFDLTRWAESAEVNRNNKAGTVELLEQNITSTFKEKKKYAEAGNALAERYCERTIQRFESDLTEAKRELKSATANNAQATRALKDFDGHARIEELKAELGL